MADELERALRKRDQELLAQSRNPRGAPPQKAGPLDLGVGLKERLAFLNQTFNPVEAIGQSMGAGERLMSGDIAAVGDMLSGVAGVAAPALVAGRAGIPAATAVMESLMGASPTQQAAADMARQFVGDESGALRGMGDNGGPAMTPQRYVNPDTGLYSPSFEAAKTLKQEVGTPQQMRSMLLKAGAKEEELVYSGFDDWLKGKEKVTKQEIEDVLGRAAAGYDYGGVDPMTGFETFPGPMPYVRVSNKADAGVTGVQGTSLGDLQDEIYERMLQDYNAERRGRLISGLQDRGYSFPQITDEASFRDFAARTRQQFNAQGPGYRGPRVPSSVINNISRIESRLTNYDEDFNSPSVQWTLQNGILNNTDGIIRPDGSMTYTRDAIADEFPDENPTLNLSRGSIPPEVQYQANRAYGMSAEQAADYLGIDVEDVLSNFSPGPSQYGAYVVPGMKNYSENLYKFDDVGRGVLSGIESLGVRRFDQPHFSEPKSPTMFFTLTGELNTADGPAYHIAQLQSDIGQSYRKDPERFFVPGTSKAELELNKSQKAVLQDYLNKAKEIEGLNNDVNSKLERLYDSYLDEYTGALRKDDPGYEEIASEIRAGRQRWSQLSDDLIDFEIKNNDLFREIESFYGDVPTMRRARVGGDNFSTGRLEEILSGKAKFKRGFGPSGKSAALPFTTSTNRWVDTALKNELIKAAKSNAEWFTLPRGEDVQKYTGGDPEGQAKFYEGIVPNRLKNLAKDFLPEGVEFRNLRAMGYGPKAPEYEVFGMRLTPEIKRAILEGGFPSFAKGGPVQGSSLDVDVFALR